MKILELLNPENFEYNWAKIESIPEFAKLKECEQSKKWHQEGTAWDHTVKVCEEAVKRLKEIDENTEGCIYYRIYILMAAALFHDIGKGVTTEFSKGDWHSYRHEVESDKMTRFLLWDEDIVIRETVCGLVRWHMDVLPCLEGRNVLEKIISLSKKVSSLELLLYLKEFDILGSIQADKDGKKRDLEKLNSIWHIATTLNAVRGPSLMRPFELLPHKTMDFKSVSVYLLFGISGSGKSTAAQKIMESEGENAVYINRDSIRAELGVCGYGEKAVGTPEEEEAVTKEEQRRILEAARSNKLIVIDNLNIKKKYREAYRKLLIDNRFYPQITYYYIQAPSFDENIKRREGSVPEAVLKQMIFNIEWPTQDEYNALVTRISKPENGTENIHTDTEIF